MENNNESIEFQSNSKQARVEVDLSNLFADPGLRKKNSNYYPSDRDQIRIAYLQKKHCQPFNHDFPQTQFEKTWRRFNPAWFKEYNGWLEYIILKNVAYCLYCYLIKPSTDNQVGGNSFVTEGLMNKSCSDFKV
jgi:hypothetical protein